MKLVKLDDILELIDGSMADLESNYENSKLQEEIKRLPTVDAVEVVYCKGCVYSYPFDEEELEDPLRVGEWRCGYWGSEMHEDDYCSCGKRRKDETDS